MAGRDTSDRPDGVGKAQKGWLMNKYNAIKAGHSGLHTLWSAMQGCEYCKRQQWRLGGWQQRAVQVKGMGENR